MILAISVVLTNRNQMVNHWNKNSKLISDGILGTDTPIGKAIPLGGKFLLYDTNTKTILKSVDINSPSGFIFDRKKNRFFVASMRDNKIIILDKNLNLLGELKNPLFNDIHSVNFGYEKKSILIANTGLDSILEIDLQGETVYEWSALENGYSQDCFGKTRTIRKGVNHNKTDYPTLYQTTHLNSAIYLDKDTIVASLFHQGEVVSINKKNNKVNKIIEGLKSPHSIYKLNHNHLMVSNTRSNCVLVFNKNGEVKTSYQFSFEWIQDAFMYSKTLYVVDSNNSNIVSYNTVSHTSNEYYQFPKDWDIYQILNI